MTKSEIRNPTSEGRNPKAEVRMDVEIRMGAMCGGFERCRPLCGQCFANLRKGVASRDRRGYRREPNAMIAERSATFSPP
jgi:hypothetical protein